MQCVREYGIIDADLITKITEIAQSDKGKFEKSQLYSAAKGQKFIDETERVSRFKKIRNETLFDLVEEYVSKINDDDQHFEYLLFRNDITMIEYEEGGFFEKHEDYLSIKSNEIQEYSLILCISADCKGGETVLFINQMTDPYVSRHTVTPFHALLFRKDITHKGNRIEKGHKTILTMNLWAFPKNESKRSVAVIFEENDDTKSNTKTDEKPDSKSDTKSEGKSADKSESGKRKRSKYIVIPLSNVQSVPNSKLAQTLAAMDIDSGDQFTDKIIVHKEYEFSHEIYEIFSRIYKHCYVKMEEVIKFNSEIFAFGFESKHIFIDPAQSKKVKGVPHGLDVVNHANLLSALFFFLAKALHLDNDFIVSHAHFGTDPMETQSGGDKLDHLDIIPEFGSDDDYEEGIQEYLGVSVQEFHKKANINDGRYEYEKWPDARSKESSFAESANMLSEFRITASDGIYLCDDMDQQSFLLDVIKKDKMSSLLVPFKCVLSEGVIFYGGGMIGNVPDKLVMTPCWLSVGEVDHILFFKRLGIKYLEDIVLSGRKCLGDFQMTNVVQRIITNDNLYYNDTEWLEVENQREKDNAKEKNHPLHGYDVKNHLIFRVNDKGQMVINDRYFEHIMQQFRGKDLVNYVKDRINSVNYKFPQIKDSVGSHFCNEDVYGSFNLVVCSGFVHIEMRKDDEAVLCAKEILAKELDSEVLPDLIIGYIPCCWSISEWERDQDSIEKMDVDEQESGVLRTGGAPRRELAAKAARMSAPSAGGVNIEQ